MATTHVLFSLLLMLCSIFLLPAWYAHPLQSCNLDQIYQLGDSISDTGNLIRESTFGAASPFARLPYGETFFKTATGRCSNGLLMIDYLAMAAGLPLLNPFKNTDAIFRHGANFAVAGSTALPTEILAVKNISSPVTGSSLSVQLDWMFTHFNSICYDERDCVEKLKNSLFFVGEIGGNDYKYALFQGKSMEEVKSMVPEIVEAIMDAVRRVIQYGAVRVVVPGNFPIGCFPIYLTGFKTNDLSAYDENHCLKALNSFSMYHNDCLQKAIEGLKQEYPNAIIVYGDHYNAFQWLLHEASNQGFDATSLQKACCGIGGDNNFSLARMCGAPEVPVCGEPNRLISWDGVQLTQEAYKVMAGKLIDDTLPQLQCMA
ncbi:GDSL esterase/lipase At5g03980-like [Cornus florida]|uniref:GDSL esterase/lipase At5g03980-like n=1 Tax=Cornus florida TaxID=4283 RepID=UPI00289721D5|nr:GDSL esterase/lipase At5g03980-like [Cornus florida]